MNSEAYEFMTSGRFDRFDSLERVDFDLWQSRQPQLVAAATSLARDCEVKANFNSRCLGADDVSGKRLYSFETWGEFSEHWAQMVSAGYWRNLQRIDFRIECDIDTTKVDGLAGFVEKNGKYGRNVSTFRTREREKKEGRQGGGKGVSIGSHKSDRRLVVYKRKGERGAIEIQVSGATLKKVVDAAFARVEAGEAKSVYAEMRIYLSAALEKMARECGFESAHALVSSIREDSPEMGPPADFVAEAPRQMLLQGFDALPANDKREVLRALNDRYLSEAGLGA